MRLALLLMIFAVGCGATGPVPPAARPRRPPPEKTAPVVSNSDCPPTQPDQSPAAFTYNQRSRSEAANMAATGSKELADGLKPGQPPQEMERLVTEAVGQLTVALKADPYNVQATYALAAGYARIGRKQCAVNLLERLSQLRKLPSFTPEVESKIDKLLGRNAYKGAL
ncbi:MAG TPA: hypothetical protein VL172_14145, partial [Kofleriaceae bacterium]|nr:hypothetical protein [Kofleriaceae bacterium]